MDTENNIFSKKIEKEFTNILRNSSEKFRLLLHNDKNCDLHNMIIGLKKNDNFPPHKHVKTESYHIIEGKLKIVYFKEDGHIEKSIILSTLDNPLARVDKNQYHAIIALTDVIYNETRIGPFVSNEDSIYPDWDYQV